MKKIICFILVFLMSISHITATEISIEYENDKLIYVVGKGEMDK